jgi:hypothetical protein
VASCLCLDGELTEGRPDPRLPHSLYADNRPSSIIPSLDFGTIAKSFRHAG